MTSQQDSEPPGDGASDPRPDAGPVGTPPTGQNAAQSPESPLPPREVSDDEVEQLFADLITRFGEPSAAIHEPGPAPPPPPPPPLPPAVSDSDQGAVQPTSASTLSWRAWEPAEPKEEIYQPEGEPIVLSRDPVVALGWVGVIGGPIVLLLIALVWPTAPSWLAALAVLAFIVGFAALVTRMPDHHSDSDDDGAVL
jgi:hypothetical protein